MQSERQKNRLNGFKGFYNIWKKRIAPKDKEESVPEEKEEEKDYVVV